MGVELRAVRDPELREFPSSNWNSILELGRRYDWQPLGTVGHWVESRDGPWDGAYKDARVTEQDALALAEALERALPRVPESEVYDEEGVQVFLVTQFRHACAD